MVTNNDAEKKKKMENKKNDDGEKKKKKKKKKEGEIDVRAKAPSVEASGRVLGRRRRAKEKRKRMAMMRRRGGGGSEEEEEEEDEERKKSAKKTEDQTKKKKEKNETTTEMTEKQKRKAEKNRARKLRREWKRKKEMEEKNARGGGGGGEKEEEEDEEEEANGKELPNEEERKEMKRLAKDYVAEKAKKRAKSASTAGGGEEEEEEEDGGRSSASGGESSEKKDESSDESEDDVAPQQRQQQPVAKKKLSLIDKMRAKLSGGHFRMLNEQLYTTKGDEALRLVQQNPGVFDAYHEGFREQVKKWPKNPVHKCFEWLQHKPYDTVIADFGCGDAELAKLIGTSKKKVYSLDLETPSHAPFVIACNMAKTPLESNSVDVAVFSLSLMGTDYYKFIEEASRVLKVKGKLWIAEVKSRFDGRNGAASIPSFVASLKTAGFDVDPKKVDEKDKMFFVLEAVKAKNHASSSSGGGEKKNNKSGKVEWPKLKVCEYKKR